MSDSASVWTGQTTGTIPVINADGNMYEEWHTATASQTVFNLASFEYTPGTNSIFVYKNGVMLRRSVDYTETSATRVTLTSGAALNDKLTFIAIALAAAEVPPFNNNPPAGGTTGQLLAKASASDYAYTWTNPPSTPASLQDGPRTNVASATTVDLTGVDDTTRNILITGTTTIAGFLITSGQLYAVKFSSALTLTNSSNLLTGTGADLKVQANDTCFIRAYADNQVEVLAYCGAAAGLAGPTFSAYRSATQSIPDITLTKVQFNNEEWDTANCYDSTTNYRFTPNVAGYYQVEACIEYAGASTGVRLATIYKNGVRHKDGNSFPANGNGVLVKASAIIYFNGTTDYIECYAYQSSGGALNTGSTTYGNYFQAALIRRA